jgi:hypothetical protein
LSESPAPAPGPQDDDYYAQSPGSGLAAILLFLHIALTGYLGFSMFYILKSLKSAPGLVAGSAMPWQYYFPAGLAVLSFFPTDPLTRTVALVARAAGWLALALPIVIIGILAAHAANVSVSAVLAILLFTVVGAGTAVLAAEWFRLGLLSLPPDRQRTIWPFYKFPPFPARLACALLWAAIMLLLASNASNHPGVLFPIAAVCLALLISRLIRSYKRRL